MKKSLLWMLTAILVFCDPAMASCSKDDAGTPEKKEYFPSWNQCEALTALQSVLDDEFGKNEFMKTINEITSRKGYQDYAERQFAMRDMEQTVKEMEERYQGV